MWFDKSDDKKPKDESHMDYWLNEEDQILAEYYCTRCGRPFFFNKCEWCKRGEQPG